MGGKDIAGMRQFIGHARPFAKASCGHLAAGGARLCLWCANAVPWTGPLLAREACSSEGRLEARLEEGPCRLGGRARVEEGGRRLMYQSAVRGLG